MGFRMREVADRWSGGRTFFVGRASRASRKDLLWLCAVVCGRDGDRSKGACSVTGGRAAGDVNNNGSGPCAGSEGGGGTGGTGLSREKDDEVTGGRASLTGCFSSARGERGERATFEESVMEVEPAAEICGRDELGRLGDAATVE